MDVTVTVLVSNIQKNWKQTDVLEFRVATEISMHAEVILSERDNMLHH